MKCAARTLLPTRLALGALALAGASFVVSVAAHAEAAPADPIDTAMRTCLARADRSSPAGQAQCMEAARDSWQAAIDVAYRSLTASAPDKARRVWDESQRRWQTWRDKEVPLVHAVFQTTHGSAYVITEANVLLQPVRDRALQLRHVAAQFDARAKPASDADPQPSKRPARLRPCTVDAACEHAQFDLNRYARKLRAKLPARSRVVLSHAQRAWLAYFEATSGLGTEAERVDLIGARVATLKRLSETAGGD